MYGSAVAQSAHAHTRSESEIDEAFTTHMVNRKVHLGREKLLYCEPRMKTNKGRSTSMERPSTQLVSELDNTL
jgi:hypothetical protein